MSGTPEIVNTIADLRARLAAARQAGRRIGLVPTMGALHEGHLGLVRQTKARCGSTVVSIFVNPTQFGPNEDFARYPRTFESDCANLAGLADVIFAPSVAEMYPDGFATRIEVGGPALGLESDFRPHFFSGVATVVAKLLIAVMPDEATFGEKDYQQLLVIRRLIADLGLPVQVRVGRTIREPNGLAMSSRNEYLTAEEREIAPQLGMTLTHVARAISDGIPISEAEKAGCEWLLQQGFSKVDYVAVRDSNTLEAVATPRPPLRILGAAWLGKTRLIDNWSVWPHLKEDPELPILP